MTNPFDPSPHVSGLDGIVRCVVGHEQYALRGAAVKAVARAEQVSIAAGGVRAGTLRHRGDAVPVYSLAGLLGRAVARPVPDNHIVVTEGASGPIGLLVDHLIRIAHGDARVAPLPPVVGPAAAAWFEGLLEIDGVACLMISPSGVDPAAPPRAPRDPGRAAATAPAGGGAAADIVVIFSSPALPAGAASHYAVSARRVGAVVQTVQAVALPGRPAYVRELAWWRDAAVVVLDFRGAGSNSVQAPEQARRGSGMRYLVVGGGPVSARAFAAFEVDADMRLHKASGDDRRIAAAYGPDFVRGVFSVGGDAVALLDVDALLVHAGAPAGDAGVRVA